MGNAVVGDVRGVGVDDVDEDLLADEVELVRSWLRVMIHLEVLLSGVGVADRLRLLGCRCHAEWRRSQRRISE